MLCTQYIVSKLKFSGFVLSTLSKNSSCQALYSVHCVKTQVFKFCTQYIESKLRFSGFVLCTSGKRPLLSGFGLIHRKEKEYVQKVSFYCHSELVEESFTLKNRCFDFAQHDNPIQNITFGTASL